MTFALAMLPHLRNGAYDLVHTIDPPLTRVLHALRRKLGLRFRLLYTEACAMPPEDYPPADHTQQIAPSSFEAAVAHGHPAEGMSLLPCGFHPERFAAGPDRAALRRAHGVDPDAFVILSVAAINRNHKRIDHLIDEVARLEGRPLLWLDGSLDHGDPDLIGYARRRLGDRCRITQVASDRVGELYRLADVMPHTATFEAFGLAMVEAAAAGLPVLVHDAPHFRWLLPRPECWVDMARPGALAERLAALMAGPIRLAALSDPASTRRFAWDALRPRYRDLYQRVAGLG
jgi:glycosyltransferase involved in cell wall biosynthesis